MGVDAPKDYIAGHAALLDRFQLLYLLVIYTPKYVGLSFEGQEAQVIAKVAAEFLKLALLYCLVSAV